MSKSNKFSPEVRERAVRMVQEHRGEYPSLWTAIESIAPKIGCVPQTLNEWVKRAKQGLAGRPVGISKTCGAHTRVPQGLRPGSSRRDADATDIERVWQANMQVYGADKVWRQLAREGVVVARCTVERLKRRLGLRGVMRGKVVRTTVGDAKAPCPLDRVNRQFRAERPNPLWVSD